METNTEAVVLVVHKVGTPKEPVIVVCKSKEGWITFFIYTNEQGPWMGSIHPTVGQTIKIVGLVPARGGFWEPISASPLPAPTPTAGIWPTVIKK